MTGRNPDPPRVLLGLHRLEQLVDWTAKSGKEGYPAFDIEQTDEHRFCITLAVAGFAEADLSITIEEGQLLVRGRQNGASTQNASTREYLHRGIASRQFQKRFGLAKGVEVAGAHLNNGLLTIRLERQPYESRVHKITIEKK